VAAWTALAGTGALRPGESVLVLGTSGQVGRIAVQVARLLGARRVTGVVRHALPAIWDDFAAGRAQTRIIVKPNEASTS